MPVETTELRQKAVLWPATGYGTSDGEHKLGDPQEIRSRWESNVDQLIGTDATTKTKDLTLIVSVDVPVGSRIWIGELADLPVTPTDLYTVKGFQKVPDVKCSKFRRTATLVRKK